MRSQDADRVTEEASALPGRGELVVHRMGPQAYTLTLRANGKVVMLAVGYFLSAEAVQEAIAWIKGSMRDAHVAWRDDG